MCTEKERVFIRCMISILSWLDRLQAGSGSAHAGIYGGGLPHPERHTLAANDYNFQKYKLISVDAQWIGKHYDYGYTNIPMPGRIFT